MMTFLSADLVDALFADTMLSFSAANPATDGPKRFPFARALVKSPSHGANLAVRSHKRAMARRWLVANCKRRPPNAHTRAECPD